MRYFPMRTYKVLSRDIKTIPFVQGQHSRTKNKRAYLVIMLSDYLTRTRCAMK
jgi:abortive infection bacteriophage resistance protein